MENSNFSTWITSLYVFQPSSVVFACKTAHIGPEFQVSMGPGPHLRFLHAKQRVLARNYKSLWVPDLNSCFSMQNSDFWSRITSLYGSQTCPVVLCMYNSGLNIRITNLYGSQPSSEVFSTHNIVLSTRINRLYWFQPSSMCFFSCKTATLWPDLQVCMGPRPHL